MDQARIDRIRDNLVEPRGHLIDGIFKPSSSGEMLDVVSPIDGQIFSSIARGTCQEVRDGVASARAAFEDGRWSRMAPAGRKKILHEWADRIEAEAPDLAVLGVRDNGTEISMALKAEPFSAAATIRYYAEALDKVYGEIAPTEHSVLGLVHREPVGVVGAIIPWNFPLMIGAWKIGPALASGNSVVLKPAEAASLSTLRMAELSLEAGLPPGVLNVVTGKGDVVGKELGLSMDVDALAFTGSGEVGRRLLEYSARSNLKRVYLELGGKSPHIVFADASDLEEAAKVVTKAIFRNSGQVCVAGSRLLVEDSIQEEFTEVVAAHASGIRVGDPLDMTTEMGAIISEQQLDRNLEFVGCAEAEGGQVRTGGKRILSETGGFYMSPTVVDQVSPTASLSRQEVFGPVLAVTSFKDEAEAIRIANSTVYGLAAGIWTSSLSRAHRVTRSIRAGVVHVNTYGGADMTVPLGGFGQSGNGQDKSLHAMDKFVNLKTAWIRL